MITTNNQLHSGNFNDMANKSFRFFNLLLFSCSDTCKVQEKGKNNYRNIISNFFATGAIT